jgi:hypothetical protein
MRLKNEDGTEFDVRIGAASKVSGARLFLYEVSSGVRVAILTARRIDAAKKKRRLVIRASRKDCYLDRSNVKELLGWIHGTAAAARPAEEIERGDVEYYAQHPEELEQEKFTIAPIFGDGGVLTDWEARARGMQAEVTRLTAEVAEGLITECLKCRAPLVRAGTARERPWLCDACFAKGR